MRLLAFLVLAASPAVAQDAHSWGLPVPCVVTVEPCGEPDCLAVVKFDNRLILGGTSTETVTLRFDDRDVIVTVLGRANRLPDVLVVVPPYGFMALPAELVVDDDSEGVVRLVPVPMG